MSELENSRSELKCKLSGAGDDGENKSKQIERLQRKVFLLTKVRRTVLYSHMVYIYGAVNLISNPILNVKTMFNRVL